MEIVTSNEKKAASMPLNTHHIPLATKSWNPIHRDTPNHFVTTIYVDTLHGDDREIIGAPISSSPIFAIQWQRS